MYLLCFIIFRMDSKEKCEQIIQMFNGNPLPGSKEPLLVKFADSGQKKRNPSYRSDSRLWRESEVRFELYVILYYPFITHALLT